MKKQSPIGCLVCGTPLKGFMGTGFRLFGIKPSKQNPNVCNRCDAHMQEGSIIELSVLFADLTGFTRMTNRLGAERSYEVVNAFFKMANDVLIRHDAFIDKYIGDAVMAIFNAPISREDHARRAVAAALEIQEGIEEVSKTVEMELKARVSIARGYARVGRIGSTDRKDYSAIGDVVNLASRLEAFARPGEIVLCERAYEQVAGDYPEVTAEESPVKGFEGPVKYYRIRKSEKGGSVEPTVMKDSLSARRRIGVATILLTIFGAPCAVAATLSPLAIILGLGTFMGAALPFFHLLDVWQIRLPLQVLAVLGAGINLFVIRYGHIHRPGSFVMEPTTRERRKIKFVVWLSVLSLLAVVYEMVIHMLVLGMPYFSPSL